MDVFAQFGVTLFWCLSGGLIIALATAMHPIIGKIVLVAACLFMLLLGALTEYWMIGALFTMLILYGAHGAVVEERAAKRAAKKAARELPAGRPSAPAEPRAESIPRPASRILACPGCGATEETRGHCAYCGRRVA